MKLSEIQLFVQTGGYIISLFYVLGVLLSLNIHWHHKPQRPSPVRKKKQSVYIAPMLISYVLILTNLFRVFYITGAKCNVSINMTKPKRRKGTFLVYCKTVLRLKSDTASYIVYGELDRTRLVERHLRILKYWTRITCISKTLNLL